MDWDESVVPFSPAFQQLAIENKLALGNIFPTLPVSIGYTLAPTAVLRSLPADLDEDDEDDGIAFAVQDVQNNLRACVARNVPPPSQQQFQPPQNIDVDGMDSMAGGNVAPSTQSSTNERIEAKLRLMCAGYSKGGGVLLFELNDSIRETLALDSKSRAEALGNFLDAESDALADTLDAINRQSDWPESYKAAPAILLMLLKGMMSTKPITDLREAAKSSTTVVHTGYFLPHGPETNAAVESLKNESSKRELQQLLGEDSTRTAKVSTKGVCATEIKGKEVIVGGCSNITTFLKVLTTFDAELLDATAVPFLQFASRTIAIFTSSKEYRKYTKRSMCNAKSNYFVFNVLDRTCSIYFRILNDEGSITAAKPSNGSTMTDRINAWNSSS